MIILAADLHLDRCLRTNNRDLELDSLSALWSLQEQILALKVEHEKEHPASIEIWRIILAGDVADSPKISGRVSQALQQFCEKLMSEGIAVHSIEGNHDHQPRYSQGAVPVAVANGAIDLHNKTVVMDGLTVCGLSYAPPEDIKEQIKTLPACDLLILHAAFQSMLGFDGAWDLCFDDIPDRVHSICAGDIHKTAKQELPHANGVPGVFLSPGALHPCDIGQGGDHGFFYKSLGGEWTFRSVVTRPIYRYEVTPENLPEPEEFLKSLPESTRQPIVSVVYAPELADYIDRLRAAAVGKAVILAQPSYVGKCLASADVRKAVTELATETITLDQALPFVLTQKEEPVVYNFLEELLQSESPAAVIENFIKQQS
jgi:hypothetical protein